MTGQVTGCGREVPDEAAQAPPAVPGDGSQWHDEEDDERCDDEGEQVEEQTRLGTDEGDECSPDGQDERLVELLRHRSETNRTSVEVTVLEDIGEQHDVGRRRRTSDQLEREQDEEHEPERRARDREPHESEDAGRPDQV